MCHLSRHFFLIPMNTSYMIESPQKLLLVYGMISFESMTQIVMSRTFVDSEVTQSGSIKDGTNSIGMYLIPQSEFTVAFLFLFSFCFPHSLFILLPDLLSSERWDLNKWMSSVSMDQVVHIGK